MKCEILKGVDNNYYLVFENSCDLEEFEFIFSDFLGWQICSFGNYENAFKIPDDF